MEASARLSSNLQAVLVDLIELHIQGKQAHWNIVGTNFRDLHLQLDEIIDSAREFSDTMAERMRALKAVPDGRTSTVAENTTLPSFPADLVDTGKAVSLVVERLDAAAATCRRVHDEVDAEDPATADLLHEFINSLEKYSWMVGAENMSA